MEQQILIVEGIEKIMTEEVTFVEIILEIGQSTEQERE